MLFGFVDSASEHAVALTHFHSYVMFFLLLVIVFVVWILKLVLRFVIFERNLLLFDAPFYLPLRLVLLHIFLRVWLIAMMLVVFWWAATFGYKAASLWDTKVPKWPLRDTDLLVNSAAMLERTPLDVFWDHDAS